MNKAHLKIITNTQQMITNSLELNDYEFDEVIINLKVIASLTVNDKLYTSGSILNIERINYVPLQIKRFLRGDSRDEAIKKIDRVISKTAFLIQRDQYRQTIITSLKEAKIGLQNLIETYITCILTKARINNLLLKIDTVIQMTGI